MPATPAVQGLITIEFGRSSSPNYLIAVDVAKKHSTYRETGTGKDIRHSVTFDFSAFEDVRELFDLVGRWKTTSFTINNRSMPASKAFMVLSCYGERCRAFNPEEYCFGRDDASSYNDNDLGCRHCGVNPYSWQGLKGLGAMTAAGAFVVDKNRLVYEVARNLEDFLWCPALNPKKVEQKLKQFPDTIDPRRNHQWEYVTEWETDKEIALAVRKKQKGPSQQYVVKDYSDFTREAAAAKTGAKRSAVSKSASGCGCLLAGAVLLILVILVMAALL